MGLAAIVAGIALAAAIQDAPPAPPETAEALPVTLPPALSARPAADAVPAPPEAPKPSAALAIPADEPRRPSRPLEDRPEPGPNVAGFIVGSFAVVGLLGGAFLLLRRFGKNSRLFAGAGAIKILARRPLGQKQELLLVEVGPKVFMIGSTRDHLSTLGEFASPDEVAQLRTQMPERKDESLRSEFQQSLKDGLRGEEAPREDRVFASIADELAEIRKTVRAWRA